MLIIFHGARNFPTFSGFLHGKLRARDCTSIIAMDHKNEAMGYENVAMGLEYDLMARK